MTADQMIALASALKWPLAAVVVLLIFRSPIVNLLTGFKNRSVKYKDTQIGAEQQAQPALPEPTPPPTPALPKVEAITLPAPPAVAGELPAKFLFESEDNPWITEIATLVRQNVQSKQFNSEEERNAWLYREGAKLEIRAEFERLYRTLFQSQLSILLAANNSLSAGGVPNEIVNQAYQEASTRHPEFFQNYPFESWLRFVTNNSLLVQNGQRWGITNKGQLYLHFLTATGYGTRANVSL